MLAQNLVEWCLLVGQYQSGGEEDKIRGVMGPTGRWAWLGEGKACQASAQEKRATAQEPSWAVAALDVVRPLVSDGIKYLKVAKVPPGGPLVCWSCAYTLLVRSGVNQATLSPEQIASWQRYLQTAQAQGRDDLAAIRAYAARPGESRQGERAFVNGLVGACHPGQLPSNYPYPTSIDDDVAVASQTSVQGTTNGQVLGTSNQPGTGTHDASRSGSSMPNGHHVPGSCTSQMRPRQTPTIAGHPPHHPGAGSYRNNIQPSRRATNARASRQRVADRDQDENSEEET
ncbi:hypothetical protein PRZ48_008456 [Zasmidium cellare]|uniref:Uncharacterized protein n=1 Tax=Zasmidium cellare TaxID=395010 RepID=A0ABR0EFH7_ZASCE|nr:hypothetical protein PRZ48_008456 [Zasmidium cellare]